MHLKPTRRNSVGFIGGNVTVHLLDFTVLLFQNIYIENVETLKSRTYNGLNRLEISANGTALQIKAS